jgi:TonB family protein
MPQFPGGATKLFEYLAQNVNYPTEAEKANIQGRVIATFVVEKDGSISNAEVVKSVAPSLDAEALRVINAMPNWIPGKQNGKEVRVKYTVPISFHLQGKDTNVAQYEGTVKYDRDAKIKPSELVVVCYDSETSQKPLVYVDGKEIPFENMSKVDPKTIDRMDVLKDKEAVDKYGEKAKNGVILITTKKK